MRTNDRADPILKGNADAIAPAYSAVGQHCAQCGGEAWYIAFIPFCRSHSQRTLARGIKRNGAEAYGIIDV